MSDWLRVAATTIADYSNKEEINVLRARKLFARLMNEGRISFNHSGTKLVWPVYYRENDIQTFGDMGSLSYGRFNRHVQAELDWRGYAMTEFYSEMEKEKNKGPQALVKAISDIAKRSMKEAESRFTRELFIDGNDSSNTDRFHGIESLLGVSGASAAQPIGVNNSTYAGLSCALQNKGGTWTGSWPAGEGDSEYDYWTPLVVDYTSAVAAGGTTGGWTSSTKTWPNTCLEALRYGITYAELKNASDRDRMDFVTMESTMFRYLKDKLQSEERIIAGSGKMTALGFPGLIEYDGVEIGSEYGLPSGTAYGWCLGATEIKSLKPKLFNPFGPNWSDENPGYKLGILIFGNVQFFSPRGFVAWKAVS